MTPVSTAVDERDIADIATLVRECRSDAAPEAFPGVSDVASLFAEESSRATARCWRDDAGTMDAWVLSQTVFGNVLFDVRPAARGRLSTDVAETGVAVLAEAGAAGVDSPLESDDAWRREVLVAAGFGPTDEDVIHLRNATPAAYAEHRLPAGMTVQSNADDLDAYVAAHRAAFGTTYLTPAGRQTWADDEGYDAALDLAFVADGGIAGFAVSYLRATDGEVGTVGVVPEQRGRGFGAVAVRRALAELVDRGALAVTMSTASTNAFMLAVAARCGFREYRRTSWWHRGL